jgi:hypothetical protein
MLTLMPYPWYLLSQRELFWSLIMKKFAAIALALSLVATSASAVVIETTIAGVVQQIDCGPDAVTLETLALSEVQKTVCRTVFETAAEDAGAAGTGTGTGAAAGFGLGGAGAAALAAIGILLVAGLGGGGSGEESVSTSATTTVD